MAKKLNAHDILAFFIVELGCNLPYEVAQDISPGDLLHTSLMDAWKEKERRADLRNALLCAVIANSLSNSKKKLKIEDFMPKKSKSKQDSEADIKANFIKYNEVLRSK